MNKCPICSSIEVVTEKENPSYSLCWCKKCDLVFTNPMKGPESAFYEDALYYKIGRILDNRPLRWQHKTFIRGKIPHSGKLLDIGCDTGLFISIAQKTGYEVTGIDVNSKAIETAISKYNLKNVFALSLEEFLVKTKDKFDVISLFEVLEHLENPRILFEQIKKILNSGGYIVLSVPNRERTLDTFVDMDLPPNHLTQWNEKSINSLLSLFGFNIVKLDKKIKIDDIVLYLSSKTSIGLVKKKISESGAEPLPGNTVHVLKIFSKIKTAHVRFASFLLYPFLSLINMQSSTIYVLAQQKKQ